MIKLLTEETINKTYMGIKLKNWFLIACISNFVFIMTEEDMRKRIINIPAHKEATKRWRNLAENKYPYYDFRHILNDVSDDFKSVFHVACSKFSDSRRGTKSAIIIVHRQSWSINLLYNPSILLIDHYFGTAYASDFNLHKLELKKADLELSKDIITGNNINGSVNNED